MSDTTPPQPDPTPGPEGESGTEVLDLGHGTALSTEKPRGRGARLAVAGAGVAALAVVGGGAFAAYHFYFSSGAQAAEALPANTLGYVGINLDPSGQQKLEALQTLKKFPAIEEKLNLDGDLRDVDPGELVFDAIKDDLPESCDLDYGDFDTWLGSRFGLGAVPGEGDTPMPVFVVEVEDADAAGAALSKISDCGGFDDAGYVVQNGWLTIAETSDQAQSVADDAAASSLADDDDYQRVVDSVGTDGLATLYAAPDALQAVIDAEAAAGMVEDSGSDLFQNAVDSFDGAAATVRFEDEGVQLDAAGTVDQDALAQLGLGGTDNEVARLVDRLPDTTGLVYGVSLPEKQITNLADALAPSAGYPDGDAFFADVSAQLGLDLPADLVTLVSQGLTLSVDGSVDPQDSGLQSGDLHGLPVALTMAGDPAEIEAVLEKIRPQLGDFSYVIDSSEGDDLLVAGPDADYRDQIVEGGSLGSSDNYTSVVPDPENTVGVLYLDFDVVSELVTALAPADDPSVTEVTDNLEPLKAFGQSVSVDGDEFHLVLRLSTD